MRFIRKEIKRIEAETRKLQKEGNLLAEHSDLLVEIFKDSASKLKHDPCVKSVKLTNKLLLDQEKSADGGLFPGGE